MIWTKAKLTNKAKTHHKESCTQTCLSRSSQTLGMTLIFPTVSDTHTQQALLTAIRAELLLQIHTFSAGSRHFHGESHSSSLPLIAEGKESGTIPGVCIKPPNRET